MTAGVPVVSMGESCQSVFMAICFHSSSTFPSPSIPPLVLAGTASVPHTQPADHPTASSRIPPARSSARHDTTAAAADAVDTASITAALLMGGGGLRCGRDGRPHAMAPKGPDGLAAAV